MKRESSLSRALSPSLNPVAVRVKIPSLPNYWGTKCSFQLFPQHLYFIVSTESAPSEAWNMSTSGTPRPLSRQDSAAAPELYSTANRPLSAVVLPNPPQYSTISPPGAPAVRNTISDNPVSPTSMDDSAAELDGTRPAPVQSRMEKRP